MDKKEPIPASEEDSFIARKIGVDDVWVYFLSTEQVAKMGVKLIESLMSTMRERGFRHMILISPVSFNSHSRKFIKDECDRTKERIEMFTRDELMLDITEHVLVPKYRVLTTMEHHTICKGHCIRDDQFPVMLRTDPIARFYGLDPGQVVEITRPSETAGSYITYRIVQ